MAFILPLKTTQSSLVWGLGTQIHPKPSTVWSQDLVSGPSLSLCPARETKVSQCPQTMGKCPGHIPSAGGSSESSLWALWVSSQRRNWKNIPKNNPVTCGSSPAPGQGLALRSAGLQAGALHSESLGGHHSAQPVCPQHRQVRHTWAAPGPSLGPQAEPGAPSQARGWGQAALTSSWNSLVTELKS